MIYVYAIKSLKRKRPYVGQTDNLDKRLTEHNKGLTKTTKFYAPWKLIYSEEYANRRITIKKRKVSKIWLWKRISK